jgi:hypothetical protein
MYCGIVKPLPIMLGKAQVSLLGQARQHTQHIGQGARPFPFEKNSCSEKLFWCHYYKCNDDHWKYNAVKKLT